MSESKVPSLKLPKIGYGPMCNKILKEFAEHFKIEEHLIFPEGKDNAAQCLSKIFDLILHSLGEEKRKELLADSLKYYYDVPPSVRD